MTLTNLLYDIYVLAKDKNDAYVTFPIELNPCFNDILDQLIAKKQSDIIIKYLTHDNMISQDIIDKIASFAFQNDNKEIKNILFDRYSTFNYCKFDNKCTSIIPQFNCMHVNNLINSVKINNIKMVKMMLESNEYNIDKYILSEVIKHGTKEMAKLFLEYI